MDLAAKFVLNTEVEKYIEGIGKPLFGALYREVICIVSLIQSVLYRRFLCTDILCPVFDVCISL